MTYFNYQIIEHNTDLDTTNTLFQLNNTNLVFANITPLTRANHVLNVYGSIFNTNEDLMNQYDGTFSFNTQNVTYNDTLASQVDQLFDVLMNCEKNNKVISIYVQTVDDDITTDFVQILNHAQVAFVIKTLKFEQKNVIGLLNMVFKKIN